MIETERRPIAPRSGLILERAGEGRCEEGAFSLLCRGRGRRRRAGEEESAGVTALLARAVRLAGGSRSAPAGPGYDDQPVNHSVGPRCQAVIRSHGAIQRMGQRPSILRPRP